MPIETNRRTLLQLFMLSPLAPLITPELVQSLLQVPEIESTDTQESLTTTLRYKTERSIFNLGDVQSMVVPSRLSPQLRSALNSFDNQITIETIAGSDVYKDIRNFTNTVVLPSHEGFDYQRSSVLVDVRLRNNNVMMFEINSPICTDIEQKFYPTRDSAILTYRFKSCDIQQPIRYLGSKQL